MNKIRLTLLLGMLCCTLAPATPYCIKNPTKNQLILSHIQQKMFDNQVLLFYEMEANPHLLSMVLLRKHHQELIKTPLPANFAETVLDFYQLLQDFSLVQKSKRVQFIQASHHFYQLLLQPIEKHLQQHEHLVVIGQGILQYLPFEVLLPNDKDGTFDSLAFFVKKHPVSYYFQLADFLKPNHSTSAAAAPNFLGFAPVFQKKKILLFRKTPPDL